MGWLFLLNFYGFISINFLIYILPLSSSSNVDDDDLNGLCSVSQAASLSKL